MSAPVTVVGVDGGPLVPAATKALADARFVVGWPRHVAAVRDTLPAGARVEVVDADLDATLAALDAAPRPAVVLSSGDPGYFGVVRALRARGHDLVVVPAVSSVATAFAAAGVAWDDAHVVSAHGRPPHRALAVCRRFPKVAVLTEPAFGPAEIGAALAGLGRQLVVAERLGHDDERITRLPAEDALHRTWADPNVVVVLDPAAEPAGRGWSAPPRASATRWALDDASFDHRAGMITKAEVRALALAWLGPGPGDLVWDVGAGSGAVAVEAARLGAAVVAVDADPDALARTAANARRHGVPVEVVTGRAPGALALLPDPDAVFVGGGGQALPAILDAAAARASRCVVVALATLERVSPTLAALAGAGLDVRATQLSAARLAPLGAGHRLAAQNPVVLVAGHRPADPPAQTSRRAAGGDEPPNGSPP
ncbi:MAG TPA: precorrin-6y C5,15-methyltransferase (decarboxylating) subunit CbiE [Egibacteraceae bacterium]|nr:precorrin-6y C5,15-methyltransferase (decarboxylating) subunit CbiE [Egibacteraceae bacterium]